MPSRRAKLGARTLALVALLLCGARASAAQTAAPSPAPAGPAGPASLVVDVDTSSSVGPLFKDGGKRVGEPFGRFFAAGGGADRFALFEVTTRPALRLDWTGDAAEVSKSLSKLLSKREVGATSLFDACALAAAKAAEGEPGRRFVLVLSDGVDTISGLTLEGVEKILQASGVRLFAVEVGEGQTAAGPYEGGLRNLSRLAAVSGGAVFRLKKAGDLGAILKSVREALGR